MSDDPVPLTADEIAFMRETLARFHSRANAGGDLATLPGYADSYARDVGRLLAEVERLTLAADNTQFLIDHTLEALGAADGENAWEAAARVMRERNATWEDIGDGVALRREGGRVVEVLAPVASDWVQLYVEESARVRLAKVGAWEQIGEAWYLRVREEQR